MGERVVGPSDVRQLTYTDLETFTVAGRIGSVLDAGADALLRSVLVDLFDLSYDKPVTAGSADRIITELLDGLHEFDQEARRLRRLIDESEGRRARLHRAVAEREARARRAEDEAAAGRAEVERAEAVLAGRVEAAGAYARREGMVLDRRRGFGPDHYRLVTDSAAHRLLPHRFDDPAGWRAVDVYVQGGRRWYVLPGAVGSLGLIEAWLEHRCGFVPGGEAAAGVTV